VTELKSKLFSALKYDETFEDWVDEQGTHYEDAVSYLGHLLGFCGCDAPEKALEYIRKRMQALKDIYKTAYENGFLKPDGMDRWKEMNAMFSDHGADYFFWYRLDNLELTEHGGSVPGWLTEKGNDYLEAITECLSEEAAN
jgi:hypothetical protein